MELLSQVDDFQNAFEDAQEALASNDTTMVSKGDKIVEIVFGQLDNFLRDIKKYPLMTFTHFKAFFSKVVEKIVEIGNQCCWTFNSSVSAATYRAVMLGLDSGFAHEQ